MPPAKLELQAMNVVRHTHVALRLVVRRIVGFDVDDGRTVKDVESLEFEGESVAGEESRGGQPDRVGAVRSAGGEHAEEWHVLSALGMAAFPVGSDAVQPVDNDDM